MVANFIFVIIAKYMNPFGECRISKAKILVTLLDLLTFEYKKSEGKSI